MNFEIVDVFAERRFAGNQLAVVRHALPLEQATMQAIAREMNFSETTFVYEPEGRPPVAAEDTVDVRIFTPGQELPFAGHPVLGTAWALSRGGFPLHLSVPAGVVPVWFDDAGLAWMQPPPAELGRPIATELAARSIGLEADALDPGLPARCLRCGPEFSFVAVRSLAALAAIRIDLDALETIGPASFPFVVCSRAHADDAHFAARMQFFDGAGLREDPATGSANAAFAAYLQVLGRRGHFVVEQGVEMGRPSRIYLDVGERIRVGGRVQPVARGKLE